MQIQLNAVLGLHQAQQPTMPVREQFQRSVDEGVKVAGFETMKRIKDRLRAGVVQQDMGDLGFADLWGSDERPDSSKQAN